MYREVSLYGDFYNEVSSINDVYFSDMWTPQAITQVVCIKHDAILLFVKGGIMIVRVPLRSALYLLYPKQDQKILKFDISIGRGEARALFHIW